MVASCSLDIGLPYRDRTFQAKVDKLTILLLLSFPSLFSLVILEYTQSLNFKAFRLRIDSAVTLLHCDARKRTYHG